MIINYELNDRFTVATHDYDNTGGNTMVSTFNIYDHEKNQTFIMHVNEEGCTLATTDLIFWEIEYDDKLVIDSANITEINPQHEYYELYRYCLIEYFKNDCLHFRNTVDLPYYLLSDELQAQVTQEYIDWKQENSHDYYTTDGYTVFIEQGFIDTQEDTSTEAVNCLFSKFELSAISGCISQYIVSAEAQGIKQPLLKDINSRLIDIYNATDEQITIHID